MNPAESAPALPALVVDGSGSRFFAGILSAHGDWAAKCTCEEAPLEGLFTTVDKVMQESGFELGEIRSYIYCEGPGSVLGLRLCAMAIETWSRLNNTSQSFFAYNSLQLTAACILDEGSSKEDTLLISDWKKDAWNSLKIADGKIGVVEPIATSELETWSGPLLHLPARKGWQQPPESAVAVNYRPEALSKHLGNTDLLKQTAGIQLYSAGVNTFQKWTPQRHRAPTSS